MDLKEQLRRLYDRHESDVGEYAWLRESDRWAELIFCLLSQYDPSAAQDTRLAVDALKYLGLLDPETMAGLDREGNEQAVVLAYVLKRHGFSEADAHRAVTLLATVAREIARGYEGKIQRYLRRHGEVMREELASAFANATLSEHQLREAISHWLQNALGMPVSLEHQAVRAFCERQGATLEDLLHAADELDLNIALVDDLLQLEEHAPGGDAT